MTAPIEDVSSLPGQKVFDPVESAIGEVKEIYAIDGDRDPMWVTVEAHATLVPEEEGTAERVEDIEKLETPKDHAGAARLGA